MTILALALAPAIFLVFLLYAWDKYEPEPIRQIIKAFVAGAISAIILIVFWILLKAVSPHFYLQLNSLPPLKRAFYSAALPEESIKLVTFLLVIFKIKDFNEWFDAIVYAGTISLGFAAVENFFYVLSGGFVTAVVRAVISVPGHLIFGITQGFFLSFAKFSRPKNLFILLALASAIALHTVFDYLLFKNSFLSLLIFAVFFYISYKLAKKLVISTVEKSQFKH